VEAANEEVYALTTRAATFVGRAMTDEETGMPDNGGAAIVVAGAVAKGAFAAGALDYVVKKLVDERTPILSVVGTSSGALNATKIAYGIRTGDPVKAAEELVTLWEEKADLLHFFDVAVLSALKGRGVSRSRRVVELLDQACPIPESCIALHDVALRIVVTSMRGDTNQRTSFEHVESFSNGAFEDRTQRTRMFTAAAASAAVPFFFEPVELANVGPCLDGGIVNNAPIKHAIVAPIRAALAAAPHVKGVVVIAADPPDMRLPERDANALAKFSLFWRLIELLVNERLFRDLEEARDVNRWLRKLDELRVVNAITDEVRSQVIESLYHRPASEFRPIDLVEIRPKTDLEGSPFSGFLAPHLPLLPLDKLRPEYIKLGREAAANADWSEWKSFGRAPSDETAARRSSAS
jgi:NTE family protein